MRSNIWPLVITLYTASGVTWSFCDRLQAFVMGVGFLSLAFCRRYWSLWVRFLPCSSIFVFILWLLISYIYSRVSMFIPHSGGGTCWLGNFSADTDSLSLSLLIPGKISQKKMPNTKHSMEELPLRMIFPLPFHTLSHLNQHYHHTSTFFRFSLSISHFCDWI